MSFTSWCNQLKFDVRRTIDIEETEHGGAELQRHLGVISVFLFTVTQAVGAGILTTPRYHRSKLRWLACLHVVLDGGDGMRSSGALPGEDGQLHIQRR